MPVVNPPSMTAASPSTRRRYVGADHHRLIGRALARLEGLEDDIGVAIGGALAGCRIDGDELTPLGTRNGVAGLSFSASFMKSATMGEASSPPVASRPMGVGLS